MYIRVMNIYIFNRNECELTIIIIYYFVCFDHFGGLVMVMKYVGRCEFMICCFLLFCANRRKIKKKPGLGIWGRLIVYS